MSLLAPFLPNEIGISVAAPSLNEVLSVFAAATPLKAPNLAGGLLVVCTVVGSVLILAWLFQAGSDAMRGSLYSAPRVLLLILAAFIVFLCTLGVFYT